jgi:hypothetical protein
MESKETFFLFSIFLLAFIFSTVKGDIPRCDGDNPDFSNNPYCLPNDYNKDIVPVTEGPLNINVDIFVFEVSIQNISKESSLVYWCQFLRSTVQALNINKELGGARTGARAHALHLPF